MRGRVQRWREQVLSTVRAHRRLSIAAAIAACLFVVAVGIAAAFGGLESVDADSTPLVEVDEVVHTGPLDVTVLRAVAIFDLEPLSTGIDGDRWIAVTTSITNTTDQTRKVRPDDVALGAPFAGQRDDEVRVILTSDGSTLVQLQPGLPTQVAFLWQQDPAQPIPSELDVRIRGYTDRRDSLSGERRWFDAAPAAELHVALTDRTASGG